LLLPEQARVTGLVTGVQTQADTPRAAVLTDDRFDQLLDGLAFDVPPLPGDSSRADIYLEHN
jgi:hypothetical protein